MQRKAMRHSQISLGFSVAPMIRALQMPAMALSVDGRVLQINTLTSDIVGLTHARVSEGLEFSQLLTPRDREHFAEFVTSIVDETAEESASFVVHWKGRSATFSLTALRDDDDALIGFLCQQPPDTLTQELVTWRAALTKGEHSVWEIDLTQNTSTFSDDWYLMRGRSRDDTSLSELSNFDERIHPDDIDLVNDKLAAVLSGQTDTLTVEFRERHKDGHFIWILTNGYVVSRGANGAPSRLIGTETDITRLKASQNLIEDLTSREVRWKVAIEGANQGVWDYDLIRGSRFVSDTWRSMRGIGPDDDIAEKLASWLTDMHPDDVPRVRAAIDSQNSGETDAVNYQYRTKHRDGRWIWILSRGRVVERRPNGDPARVIGTDTDISDIKTVEFEHAQMTDRLRVAMRAADMGRWEFNLRDEVAYWDDRLLEMFGMEGQSNVQPGDFWATLIHPDDQERANRISEESVEKGLDLNLDYRIVRPDGKVVHVRSRAIFVPDSARGDRFVGVNIDVSKDVERQQQLEAARALLEYESRHDALTGLTNRRGLDEIQETFLNGDTGQRRAVLHIDLDNFKQINDTLGHGAGDAVLVHAAGILRAAAEDNWFTARVGGDEFVMLLPDAPPDDELREIATDIIDQMAAPFSFEGQPCNFGVSIGIAVSGQEDTADASLIISADLALYAAKKDGRGRCRFFGAEMKKNAADRKNAFDALLAGFEQGEIICHYQPQFDARTLELTGLEALVRWQSPTRGLLMPDTFLPTAEEMGMIADFDALVLQRANQDLAAWDDQGLIVPRVSVNVSAARLSDPDLAKTLRSMNLPAGRFAFELLESAFLDSYGEALAENLDALKDLGIEVEVDDFGTGHASIVSLLKVSPDRLKIDRELIAPITHSQRQRSLIKTIISIGQMQDVAVVAEGVETPKHAQILKDLGCDYLQGYALGRPLPFEKTSEFIRLLGNNAGRLILAA